MKYRTLRIVAATLYEQTLAEKAYIGNFWTSLSSTGLYVITNLAFLDLLFKRAGNIAGYTKNDYYFMMFIGQLTFYLVSALLVDSMATIIDSVRKGSFDLVLLKPVPARTYLYARAARPISFLIATVPNFILIGLLIKWSELNLNLLSVIYGISVWVAGFVIYNTVLFAVIVPVFTHGDSSDLLRAYFSSSGNDSMPFAKLPTFVKFLGFTLFPSILMSAGATAIILMKTPPYFILFTSLVVSLLSIFVLSLLWKYALRNYTSASS